jgi:hypothetical protein
MGKLNNRQTIPAGGFEPSPSGGLHNSSMGDMYPWAVIGIGDEFAAFNALDGYVGPRCKTYDHALGHVYECIHVDNDDGDDVVDPAECQAIPLRMRDAEYCDSCGRIVTRR